MADRSGPPGDVKYAINFNVKDHAKLGGQFGVVNGNVHIYDVGPSASPAKKFATALNLLDGNIPRRAEELIREAAEAGYRSHKVAYYWSLSILSARSFDHLGQDEFSSLQACSAMVDPNHRDGWLEALNVITHFVNCLTQQERVGGPPAEEFDQVISEYDALQDKRRDEIRRHLDLIMTGALQDRLDARFAEEVKQHRMGGNREQRAWKFFAPIPCPPQRAVLTAPAFSLGRQVAAVTGGAISAVVLLMVWVIAVLHQPLLVLVSVAGTAGGGYLLATRGRSWLVCKEQLAMDAARHGEPTAAGRYTLPPPPEDEEEGFTWGETDAADDKKTNELQQQDVFRAAVSLYVDLRFAGENPDGANGRRDWESATHGLRQALAAGICRRYAAPDRSLGSVTWLINWYATRARKQWDNGTLRAHRDELLATTGQGTTALGGVALTAGLVCGAVGALIVSPGAGLVALLICAAGGWLLVGSRFDVHVVQLDLYQAESALADTGHADEKAAFDRWAKVLEDRPTDAEMARWLDYDKFYVKNLAMNTVGLANRDLIAHAILTEARYPYLRARVVFGPPRYSAYRVVIFLLTEAGVRQVTTDLDFLAGIVGNQRRINFRYDAISSARVAEVGIRFDSGRRNVVVLDDDDDRTEPQEDMDSLILSQALRLSLLDGQHLDVVVENFDLEFLDRHREDKDKMLELALDSSGVKGALRLLESIAAEGREWLQAERGRRNRRLLDFWQTLSGSRELTWRRDGGLPALDGGWTPRPPRPRLPELPAKPGAGPLNSYDSTDRY